jgi:hypothetical protein
LSNKHIAFFFLLVLVFIQLPFNAFHSHETDAHFIAKNSQSDIQHHCELDDLFCETGFDHTCEHGAHIKRVHPECFTCTYHFVKYFIGSVQTEVLNVCVYFNRQGSIEISDIKGAFAFHNSRGPPFFAVI